MKTFIYIAVTVDKSQVDSPESISFEHTMVRAANDDAAYSTGVVGSAAQSRVHVHAEDAHDQ